ncbi:MAG: carbohydrate ABC transporter permease [Anaerolineae bacterium]
MPGHKHWERWLLVVLCVVIVLLPLLWTVLASFGVLVDNTVTPPLWSWPPTLASYAEINIEQTYFWQEFATTILLSAVITLLTTGIAFMAAYALARSRFCWRRIMVQGCLVLGSLPVFSFIFPLSDMLRVLRLHDTFVGMTLAECALFAPLAVYILHGYIKQVPTEWEESAYLDGAGLRQVLTRVVLPAVYPGLIATAVIIFTLSWNQYYLPTILTGIHIKVIPVMMRDFFALERDFDWRLAAGVLIISLLPVSLVVAAAHRVMERFIFVPLTENG